METPESETTGTLKVSGPGGISAKVTGIDTKLVLMVILVIGLIAYIAWTGYQKQQWDMSAQRLYLEQHKIDQTMINTVITNEVAILQLLQSTASKDDMDSVTYVLALTQARREALRLEMPPGLRRKLNGNM